jgi:ABC-type polysaccharide/polyol phosphate export permease
MENPSIRFIPNQRYEEGLIAPLLLLIHNTVEHRELLFLLARRDISSIFKRSVLIGIISWVFLQRTAILQPGDVGVPYLTYVLVGSVIWGFFLSSISAVSSSLTSARPLLMHTYFPHEVLFTMQLLVRLSYFGVALGVTLAVMLVLRVVPVWGALSFPLVILPLILLASAIGLIVAMIAIVSLDIDRLITGSVGLMLYFTPVLYNVDSIHIFWLRRLVQFNPLSYLVAAARDTLLYGHFVYTRGYTFSAILAVVAFIFAWRLFYVREHSLVERMI